MTHTIHLLPSGHEFEAAESESLLEAGLSHGINLHYNCSNGTCGRCKARLVSGEISRVDFHDYVLSAMDKAERNLLMCRAHAGSDLVLEAQEVTDTAEIPRQSIRAKVAKIDDLNENYRLLVVRTPRTQTLRFLAGQLVRLTLESGMSKVLPIASCPCNGLMLQFHLRNKREDEFCRNVFDDLAVGERVQLDGPFGTVTLDDGHERPLLFVAVDTGFAPVKSLIEHAISLDYREPIALFWISSRSNGHYLSNYCRSWQDALDDFTYIPIQAEVVAGDPDLTRLLAQTVAQTFPELSAYALYIAALPAVAEVFEETLVASGIAADAVFRIELPAKAEFSPRDKDTMAGNIGEHTVS